MTQPIVVALLCVLVLTPARDARAVEAGQAVPNCSLSSAPGEQPIDIHQFRGKVVYVDFWASWCAPCVQSFPFLNDLDRELRVKGLQILGINVDRKLADAENFLRKHPARFTVAFDADGRCPRTFDVQGMPSSYLVDRKGVVRKVHRGFRRDEAALLRGMVEVLLAETPAEN